MSEQPLLPLIEQLLGQTHRAGRGNVMALCPFPHAGGRDTSPSFAIHTVSGLWMCHSCKRCGNFRSLLKGLGAPATLFGTDLVELMNSVREATEVAVYRNPYAWVPPSPPEEVLPEECLGLFDEAPRQMLAWGFSKPLLRRFDVGYDKKACRITFPLRDYTGQLIGFSGRAIHDTQVPRYKLYGKPEYERWGMPPLDPPEKSRIIWNYDQVVAAALHDPYPQIMVAEGFKACLWLRQCGFPLCIALLGSSMSEAQQRLLERLGGTLYLFLDQDSAGDHRYDMAAQLVNACDVRLPQYPRPGKLQPDSLSPAELTFAVQTAPTLLQYTLNKHT